MTTIINANNTGLTQTVDTSGILQIQTANTAAITIDLSQNITCNSTGAITVSSGTTAQRPSSPANGMLRYNTTLACFEVYANNTWALSNVTPPPVNTVAPVASGSAVVGQTLTTTNGTWNFSPTGYYYQWRANSVAIVANATSNTFVLTTTQNGANITCNVTAFNNAGNSTPATSNTIGPVVQQYTATYLVIAGGGGGGGGTNYNTGAGGGGAGGYKESSATFQASTVYTITVGGGGSSGGQGSNGGQGSDSSISGTGLSTITSTGGGYGAAYGNSGGNGGSGGGGGPGAGSGTAGQGNNGGYNTSGAPYYGKGISGGGGAGAAGGNTGSGPSGSNGGNGLSSSITGSSVTRAGGGGGGAIAGGSAGSGGAGGGGNASAGGGPGSAGSTNTGGGGGGGSYANSLGGTANPSGGTGGSGVVIISVPTVSYSGTYTGANVSITTSGSNTIMSFYSSGTYTA